MTKKKKTEKTITNKIKMRIFQALLPSVLIYFIFWAIGSFEWEIFLGLFLGTIGSILILMLSKEVK